MTKVIIGEYEGSIYPENGGYTGAISLGLNPDGTRKRLKRKGKTKAQVKKRLGDAIDDLKQGITTDSSYTVGQCVLDFLAKGLRDKSDNTRRTYESLARNHIIRKIGAIKLKEFDCDQVDDWLEELSRHLSTETLGMVHNVLSRSIHRAQRRNQVIRNVSELCDTPIGQKGRPSKSLTMEQSVRLLTEARKPSWPLGAYVCLSLMTGIRTEEARALTWDDVDLEEGAIYIVHSDRHNNATKTEASRRGVGIARLAVDELKGLKVRQDAVRRAAGQCWQENNLVFCNADGSPLTAAQVRSQFRKIVRAADIEGGWTPRELRHTFVSLMSDHGLNIEKIADMVGHSSTSTTQKVYRHRLRPVVVGGAEAMDTIFNTRSA